MASRGMHEKFSPQKSPLQDDTRFRLVTLAGEQRDGDWGQAVQKDIPKDLVGQLWEEERCLKLRPLSANNSILINSIPYLQMHSLVLKLTVFCSQCHCLYR